ncbi:PucR family transcriptional regulator [Levilactobacillus mulengensis]|uniref:PucR family transcriptional regulator n=1 Tax=Levilactobacillus mulengensis TaxID=2486025 RepID=UPI0013DDAF0D|nr:helix-turn-helix domain-containing protein [Levilactobacillus mulengensis]
MTNETFLLNAIQCASLDQLMGLIGTYLEQPVSIVDQAGTTISQSPSAITQPDQSRTRILLDPQALHPWYLVRAQPQTIPADQLRLALQVINNFTDRYALNPNQREVNAVLAQLLQSPAQADTHLLRSLITDKIVCVTVTAEPGTAHPAELVTALQTLAAPLPLTETSAGLVLLLSASQLPQTQAVLTKLGKQTHHVFFISEPYEDVAQTPEFLSICRQAEQIARRLGTVTVLNPTQKYNIYIILDHVDNGKLLKNTMCTQLLTLKQYDEAHHAALFNTLYAYLENDCHVTKTAAKLHLHRNSLGKRLTKIQALIDIDFDNPDRTFGMRLSYRLFNYLAL